MRGHFRESRRAFLQGVGAAGMMLIVRNVCMPAQRAALVIRATSVDRRFLGLDLALLANAGAVPRKVVLAHDLEADKIGPSGFQQPPAGLTTGMFVATAALPTYFGQPLGLLIFDDYRALRKAEKLLHFNGAIARYGPREDA